MMRHVRLRFVVFVGLIGLLAWSCSSVPITGRRQLSLVPEDQIIAMAASQYDTVLMTHKLSTNKEQTAMIKRCIVAGTTGQVCNGAPTLSCCNLFGNSSGDAICGVDGGGNFSANPQFCAADPAATLNPLLQADSPCAPGNHPGGADCGLIGAGPVGCSTVAAHLRTWSEIKRLYQH